MVHWNLLVVALIKTAVITLAIDDNGIVQQTIEITTIDDLNLGPVLDQDLEIEIITKDLTTSMKVMLDWKNNNSRGEDTINNIQPQ